MKLIRLRVKHFQCIESADVEFGPGLNVLYGPNDLGKSTLAAAVRAALLVQHGTAASEVFIPWHLDVAPEVELVLCAADERHYRVRKRFGSGGKGSATLEISNDGVQFSDDCKGRQVDGRLRDLLGWGLSEPGGRGGPRGIPESFLTQVLLAAQSDVPDVLGKGLAGDPTDAGRQRLNQALAALAEHPLFKQVLERAELKVSEAYSATGKRRSGKGSPFAQHKLALDELEKDRRTLDGAMASTEAIRRSLREAVAARDAALERSEASARALALCETQLAQSRARHEAERKLEEARAVLEGMQRQREGLRVAERVLGELERTCVDAAAQVERTQAEHDAKVSACEATKGQLAEVRSADGGRRRALEVKRLEGEISELQSARTQAEQREKDAARAQQAQSAADEARADADRKRQACEAAVRARDAAAKALNEALAQSAQLDALKRCEQVRAARVRLEELRDRLDDAESLEATARERGEEGSRAEQALLALRVPDDGALEQLRELHRRLEVANARLGGGLSLVLRLAKNVQLHAQVDGQTVHEGTGEGELRFDAHKSLHLQLGDLGELEIRAGEAQARAEADALQRRWRLEALPVLAAAGAADLQALLAQCKRAAGLARARDDARRAADNLTQRARDMRASAADLQASQAELERCTLQSAGLDLAKLEAELDRLGPAASASLDERVRKASADRELAQARVTSASSQAASTEAALQAALEAASRAAVAAREAAAGFGTDASPQQELEQAIAARQHAQREIEARRKAMEALATAGVREIADAQQAHERAVTALDEAKRACEQARLAAARAGEERAAQQARVEDAQRAVQALDLVGAQAILRQRESEFAKCPLPVHDPSERDLDNARRAVEQHAAEVEVQRFEITKLEGRLEETGGDTLTERLRETERAIENAHNRLDEVDLDYKAWRLLAETLRESENAEGAHLGKRLAQPVTARFAQLTGGRYGALQLDAHLAAAGLQVRGGVRDIGALSVGTQDQLATLFRLCIAEELQSALLLDDHLAQSDPERIAWFRDTLRAAAHKVQVVLFTCRPADYLRDEEKPGAGVAALSRAAGLLRVVDLDRVIVRDRPTRVEASAARV